MRIRFKRLKNEKRAMELTDALALIYRVIFIAICLFVFVLFLNMLLNPFPNTINKAKAEILLGRVFYSKAIHFNTSERIYTDILDVDKFERLNSTNSLGQYFREEFYHPSRTNLLVFKLDITYLNNVGVEINKIYFSNDTEYDLLYPKHAKKGEGAVTLLERDYITSCLVNSEIIPCTNHLNLLVPNS